MITASEPKGIENSEGLKSDKFVRRSCSSDSKRFPSNVSTLGVRGPEDDWESGDPGVSVTTSMGSTGDAAGENDNEVSIVKA